MIRRDRYLPVTLAVLILVSSPALAGSIPQMDRTSYPNQLFWLGISFVVLYAFVAGFIAPTLGRILATRASAINDAISDAELARTTADRTRTAFEAEGAGARNKAAEIVAAAQAANTAHASESMAKLDHDLRRKLEQTETRIADAKAKALGGIQDATATLAQAMAEKLLGVSVSTDAVQQSVGVATVHKKRA